MTRLGVNIYDGKTILEIVHDFAVVRGDLSERYARDQLVRIIEARIAEAREQERELIAQAIWAAKPSHPTRVYTSEDRAFDAAARIARGAVQ